jgi:hypothetical protein
MAYQSGTRTNEERKERRRLQTRLAQRRYRGRKRREAQSDQLEDGHAESSSATSSYGNHRSHYSNDTTPTIVGDASIQELFDLPEGMFLTSPSSSANATSTATNSSDADTSLSSSSSSASSPSSSLTALKDAADRDGFVGMALTTHNKTDLMELLIGDMTAHITSQLLRSQGEGVFIPRLDFYRAFFANTFALSFIPGDVQQCRMESRIAQVWKTKSPLMSVPDNMIPIEEQFEIPHSIVVDILPWPSVRRKALKAIEAGLLDMDDFKKDAFFGCKEDTNYQSSFQIHGASIDDDYYFNSTGAADLTMDAESWQCSESWLEKYWFLVDEKIVKRTNWWRRMQGLLPIKVPLLPEQMYTSRLVEMNCA